MGKLDLGLQIYVGQKLLLAISNYSTWRYLGEQELLKAGAAKDRHTSETSSEHSILYRQKH